MAGRILRKSRSNRMIAGVVAGISEYLGIDPTVGRIAYVLLTVASFGTGILVYVICMFVMPND
jgi:phage shock protein C